MALERRNCWEVMQCGREPGGSKVDELGVCPTSTDVRYDGVNGGKNGGRFCWAVSGTFCKGQVQGTFAAKFRNCLACRFYLEVEEQEGRVFVLTPFGLRDF